VIHLRYQLLRRQRWGGQWCEVSPGKMLLRLHLNQGLGMVVCACHPSCAGSINSGIVVQGGLGIKVRPYLKKKKKAKRTGGLAEVGAFV
jgi:hypothetical protein